jgi:hypothetical protein
MAGTGGDAGGTLVTANAPAAPLIPANARAAPLIFANAAAAPLIPANAAAAPLITSNAAVVSSGGQCGGAALRLANFGGSAVEGPVSFFSRLGSLLIAAWV